MAPRQRPAGPIAVKSEFESEDAINQTSKLSVGPVRRRSAGIFASIPSDELIPYVSTNIPNTNNTRKYNQPKPRPSKVFSGIVGLKVSQNTVSVDVIANLVDALEHFKQKGRQTPWADQNIVAMTDLIDKRYNRIVEEWRDKSELDLVHYCIIHNGWKFMDVLLSKNILSKSHTPKVCPYAHLAALLNLSDCLRVILINRPDDYFKVTNPEQSQIPLTIRRRFNFKESKDINDANLKSRIKNLLKDVVKSSKETTNKLRINSEFIDTLEDTEMPKSVVEVSKKKTTVTYADDKKNPRRISSFRKGAGRSHRLESKLSTSSSSSCCSLLSSSVRYNQQSNVVKRRSTFLTHPETVKGKHSIFTFSSPLSEESLDKGVLGGAGVKVQKSRVDCTYQVDIEAVSEPVDQLPVNIDEIDPSEMQYEQSEDESHLPCPAGDARIRANSTVKQTSHSIGLQRRQSTFGNANQNAKQKAQEAKRQSAEDTDYFMDETPLTLAAKRGFYQCVKVILEVVVAKQHGMTESDNPLTVATKARSVSSLLVLFETSVKFDDYQDAILVSLRNNYPGCLAILLSKVQHPDFRRRLVDGDSLFNVLYTQNDGNQMLNFVSDGICLPEMTKTLITCEEPVAGLNLKTTNYPLYTLISCAFNDTRPISHQYLTCFNMLLSAGAEIDCKEYESDNTSVRKISREKFSTLVECILTNATKSQLLVANPTFVKTLVKSFLVQLMTHLSFKRYRNITEILFTYIRHCAVFGLDIVILKLMLKHGADPGYQHKDSYMYPINVYFDHLFPHLEKYEVNDSVNYFTEEIDNMALLCRRMSRSELHDALILFLDKQRPKMPAQGIYVTKYFCHVVGQLLIKPRALKELSYLAVWNQVCQRKHRVAKLLPVGEHIRALIMP